MPNYLGYPCFILGWDSSQIAYTQHMRINDRGYRSTFAGLVSILSILFLTSAVLAEPGLGEASTQNTNISQKAEMLTEGERSRLSQSDNGNIDLPKLPREDLPDP